MLDILIKELNQSASKTINYLSQQSEESGSYGEEITDLACYYKSALMFVLAKEEEKAHKVLDYIKLNFMKENGDFCTSNEMKSIKDEYSEYWTYTNGWILRAANRLERADITSDGFQYIEPLFQESTSGFLSNNPEITNDITDVLTTAHFGLLSLEKNNLQKATAAGNYLIEALSKQEDLSQGFHLRFDDEGNPITQFEEEKMPFYFVNATEPDQLYFMIGYPAAFLAILYEQTENEIYLNAAKQYLDFALSCPNVCQCNFSHKLAWAASLIYKHTLDESYLDTIENITQFFINTQDEQGLWFSDDITIAFDQSAEIVCWFMEISTALQHVKMLKDDDNSENEQNLSARCN